MDLASVPSSPACTASVRGCRLGLITEGPDRLAALLALIDGAKERIRLLFYIFKDDESGHRVRGALLAACARGVKADILIDGFGCEGVPDAFFRPLLDHGCSFCRFEPRWGRRYLLRNHQKLAVADNNHVLFGGFNIADDYFGTTESGAWRDLGVILYGEGVAGLAAYFDDLFVWARSKHTRIRDLPRLLNRHSQRAGPLRWLFGGPGQRLSPWALAVKRDMLHGRRLDLVAAYFAPNRAMLRRIAGVARRGGTRIITAAKSDNGATIGAARHIYGGLLRRGAEVYEYERTKLHTKLIIIDDAVHLGSANFDMRSLYLNLEIMLRVEDPEFARQVRAYFEHELADSLRITRALHNRRRSWINRLLWALCYFVVATMDYNVARRLNFGVMPR